MSDTGFNRRPRTYGHSDVHDVVHVDDLARAPLVLEEILDDPHSLIPYKPVVPLRSEPNQLLVLLR